MPIVKYFSEDAFDEACKERILQQLTKYDPNVTSVAMEKCFFVESKIPIMPESNEEYLLRWLFKLPHQDDIIKKNSALTEDNSSVLIEIGPRFNFSSPFSTNCVNICQNVGLEQIKRIEASTRYLVSFKNSIKTEEIIELLMDKMTECCYTKSNVPVESFDEKLPIADKSWHNIPIIIEGSEALQKFNNLLGLSFSDWDIEYYTNLFQNILKRDPTTVEIFDCAQSNSEHSRHWFFRGDIIVDGKKRSKSLIQMIIDTQTSSNSNNTIKFSDNSSAIQGFNYNAIRPSCFDGPGPIYIKNTKCDLVFTAETHNMPTAISPFCGAATGTGGRLRDVQGVGRGGIAIAGTAGYCVGNLRIPNYSLVYENEDFSYPSSFAKPLKILIDASNGASDYGNKFGEPVILGFAVSYGLKSAGGSRDEYVKPIMFSGGLGIMNSSMRSKIPPEKGMLLAKIGGPVYRIGLGGGAASSVVVQGVNDSQLDFSAVQRGDAEMENKMNRVVRTCIEMDENNPILAIHDQGAGGNGNVLKELVEPGLAGATVFSKEFILGDPTITALELWAAEYQESNAILCKPEDRHILQNICERERCPICFVGIVTGDGCVKLVESKADFDKALNDNADWGLLPYNMDLKYVLGDMPKQKYNIRSPRIQLKSLDFPPFINCSRSLDIVLSILSVGSKRFLTNKVDRCVTGLIAQQQCVGPLHTPLADFGLVAVSYFGTEGIGTSIGTQPMKGLTCPKSMARMCVAEALSNLVFLKISELADIKCSANWMWPAKLEGEGSRIYDACEEMCSLMKDLSIAVDGGKDSLSMAAKIGQEVVKSPGTLVISTYAPCPDIRIKVTPDLKAPARNKEGAILWINIDGKFRLGGSALAQAYCQQGKHCPTVQNSKVLKDAFNTTQSLLKDDKILSGHDISDGGLIVTLLEMAFGGISGLEIDLTEVIKEINIKNIDIEGLPRDIEELAILFAEECGWVMEVENSFMPEIVDLFSSLQIPTYYIGRSKNYGLDSQIQIVSRDKILLKSTVRDFFRKWEKTSFEIEKLQANPACAIEEFTSLDYRTGPKYKCSIDLSSEIILARSSNTVRVAVLREEGINSDRELFASLIKANFEVHDVCMTDLLMKKCYLEKYRGVVFPGGFSYADSLGSAKGWASNIMFNNDLSIQFKAFKNRATTFSLGICNGCQLMSLIEWIGEKPDIIGEGTGVVNIPSVSLLQNKSERFECRWTTVRIEKSNSIMLKQLEGSILGCWAAHGEGRFHFKNQNVLENLKEKHCISLRYVDDNCEATETYPMNPNGSIEGIAGICSTNGRHLALMPHPERSSSMFQWPYVTPDFNAKTSPWQIMFNTAYAWSLENS